MNQLKAGAVLNYLVIFTNTIVGLLYTPYMLRMMGKSEYGLYSLVASVIAYLTILDLGLGNAIVRYTAKYRSENKINEQYEMFGMFIILYLIIGLISLCLGGGLLYNIDDIFSESMTELEIDRARIMLMLMIFNVAFSFPLSIFGSIINAYEHFIFPRVVNIVRIIANTLIMIILLSWGYKAIAMVVLQTIFNFLTLGANCYYCFKILKIKILISKFKFDFVKEVLVYSFWIFLNVIMDRIYWSTGQFVLGAMVGTAAVAIYAIAIQLQSMYMQFSNAIASLFLPRVTSIVIRQNSTKEISDLFIKTGRIQYAILLYVLCGFIIFGDVFIRLWAGDDYGDAFTISLIFFIPLTVPLIQNLGITILQARNEMKFRSILYFIISIFSLVLQICLSKKYGGIGCAVAIAFALTIGQILIMNFYYSVQQKIDIIRFWKEIFKMSLAPIIVLLFFLFLFFYFIEINDWFDIIWGFFVYSLIYLPIFYIYSLNSNEKIVIKGIVKSLKSK